MRSLKIIYTATLLFVYNFMGANVKAETSMEMSNSCFPPLQKEYFTCYPPDVKEPNPIKCPALKCSQIETPEEGHCCKADVNWTLCWKDSKAEINYLDTSSDDSDLKECGEFKCSLKDASEDEILQPDRCCSATDEIVDLVCCYDPRSPDLKCALDPILRPDPFTCQSIKCSKGHCKAQHQCCEHENKFGKAVCCLNEELYNIPPPAKIETSTTIVSSDLGEMTCYDMANKKPNYLQCPKFSCTGSVMGSLGNQKYQCCTFEALGISWTCCKDTGCSRSFFILQLPKCREVRCDVSKSIVKDWLGKGCCEDNSGPKPMTCCFLKYNEGQDMIYCFPREVKEPEYLQCKDMELDTIKICQIKIFKNYFCCKKHFLGGPKTCCVGALL